MRGEERKMEERVHAPMTPGRYLELEFLEPLEMSAYALAKALKVDAPRVYQIVAGKRAITADTALRLARLFGTSEQYWINLQSRYDLEKAKMEGGEKIESEVRPLAMA